MLRPTRNSAGDRCGSLIAELVSHLIEPIEKQNRIAREKILNRDSLAIIDPEQDAADRVLDRIAGSGGREVTQIAAGAEPFAS